VNDLKLNDSIRDAIWGMAGGGVCAAASSNGPQCLQTESGQPLPTWNQDACGCLEEYMEHYRAGTWITLNDISGLQCGEGGPHIAANPSGSENTTDSTTETPPKEIVSTSTAAPPAPPSWLILVGLSAATACASLA